MSVPVVRSHSSPPEDSSAPPRKASIRLQERRGSNLSLLLDVSSLGVEPVCSVSTPKEVWLQLLHTSSRPLTQTLLRDAATDTLTLNTEYQKIPPNFVSAVELDVPGHTIKDRYKTILPNPDSRVVLKSLEEEAGPDRYINANYIRGYKGVPQTYIATQGPMLHTVEDFWDMVWQERCSIVVMVTRLKENNEKCERYWPEPQNRRGLTEEEEDQEEEGEEEEEQRGGAAGGAAGGGAVFGRFQLRVTDRTQTEDFTITDLQVQVSSECRPVRHYWFTSWPDHHVPQCTAPLLRLVEEVEVYRKSLVDPGPIVVHCSAGIGRTGCFIASSIGCQQLRETGQADILETVCQLRLDRGGMIQTSEQYQFLYATLAQYSSLLLDQQNQYSSQLQNQQNPDSSSHHLSSQLQNPDSSSHHLSSQLQNLQLDNAHTPQNPRD